MDSDSGGSFATLTHARLRVAQGDVGGAVRILRVILGVQPGHSEARDLLDRLEGHVAVAHREPADEPAPAVVPALSGDLTRRFRDALCEPRRSASVLRLSVWLARTQRNRGARRAR